MSNGSFEQAVRAMSSPPPIRRRIGLGQPVGDPRAARAQASEAESQRLQVQQHEHFTAVRCNKLCVRATWAWTSHPMTKMTTTSSIWTLLIPKIIHEQEHANLRLYLYLLNLLKLRQLHSYLPAADSCGREIMRN